MNKKKLLIAKVVALAIFPLMLLILPATFFDKGRDLCLFTLLSGYHCPGCGLTRACMHLIHFDLGQAMMFNPKAIFILPIISFLYLKYFIKTCKSYFRIKSLVITNDNQQQQTNDLKP